MQYVKKPSKVNIKSRPETPSQSSTMFSQNFRATPYPAQRETNATFAPNPVPQKVPLEDPIIDLCSLIPPPNPLPTIAFTVDEDNDSSPMKRQQVPLPRNHKKTFSEATAVEMLEKDSEMDEPEDEESPRVSRNWQPKPTSEQKVLKKVITSQDMRERIEKVLKKHGLNGLYQLEFQDSYNSNNNPIVYSREGKASYSTKEKLTGKCTFTVKDMQNYMNKGKSDWKWNFPAIQSPYYAPQNENDTTLVFESRFESGNLGLAAKINETEYILTMQNDTLTKGNTQWFYFRVGNTTQGLTVRFHIINFSKSESLYSQSMKILVRSQVEDKANNKGWHRAGTDIQYSKSPFTKEDGSRSYYTLSFTYTFEYTKDTVYFAYAEPYTYTELQTYIAAKERNARTKKLITREALCHTIGGLKCEVLTITAPNGTSKGKSGVVLTSRVHPGETVGSWMMKGAIDFLLGESVEARELREKYVFKVIPMLNPDGVFQGNYRTSLSGCDLNRRYYNPDKLLHPTIYATKCFVKNFTKSLPLALYCDLHGHSKSKDVFMYGNTSETSPEEYRIFPFIMSKICPYFSFKSSRFSVQKSKASTARITMWKELAVPYIYTLESSFLGPSLVDIEGGHFSSSHLEQIGKNLCEAIRLFSRMKEPITSALTNPLSGNVPLRSEEEKDNKIVCEKLSEEEKDILTDILNHREQMLETKAEEESDDGSDSNPSEDNMDPKEILPIAIIRGTASKSTIERGKLEPKNTEKPKTTGNQRLPGKKYKFPKRIPLYCPPREMYRTTTKPEIKPIENKSQVKKTCIENFRSQPKSITTSSTRITAGILEGATKFNERRGSNWKDQKVVLQFPMKDEMGIAKIGVKGSNIQTGGNANKTGGFEDGIRKSNQIQAKELFRYHYNNTPATTKSGIIDEPVKRKGTRSTQPFTRDVRSSVTRQNGIYVTYKGKGEIKAKPLPSRKQLQIGRTSSTTYVSGYNAEPMGGYANELFAYPTMISTKCLYFKR